MKLHHNEFYHKHNCSLTWHRIFFRQFKSIFRSHMKHQKMVCEHNFFFVIMMFFRSFSCEKNVRESNVTSLWIINKYFLQSGSKNLQGLLMMCQQWTLMHVLFLSEHCFSRILMFAMSVQLKENKPFFYKREKKVIYAIANPTETKNPRHVICGVEYLRCNAKRCTSFVSALICTFVGL